MDIRQGIALLPAGKRRRTLDQWLTDQVTERFRGRILGIDAEVAAVCGTLLAQNRLLSDARRIINVWLAAIALHHGLVIVTRNERDFRDMGVKIFNPWAQGARP